MTNFKNTSILSVVALFCALAALVFMLIHVFGQKTKTVYVSNIELFNSFDMAKDMAQKHEGAIKQKKVVFDSLYNVYTILKPQKNTEVLVSLEKRLQQKEVEIRQMEEYYTKQVSQQVWDRLNGYIKEFGAENSYEFILGTQGSGNIMYAKEDLNVTQDLLEYVNNKYQGN